MGEVRERCRLLEEHKYWNESEPSNHQFFKVMICDFEQRLRVPKKFVRKFRGSLLNTVRLKGPSGDTWTVEAVRRADQLFFQKGWAKFVQDHGLKNTDFLVFRFAGNSCFNVLIFDNSGCEREGSYFVNKHGVSCSDKGCVMERKEQEEEVPSHFKDPHEVIDLDDDDDDEDTMKEVKAKPIGSQKDVMQKRTQGLKLCGMSKHKEWVEVKGKGTKRKVQDAVKKASTSGEEASDTKPVVKLERKPKIRYSYVPK